MALPLRVASTDPVISSMPVSGFTITKVDDNNYTFGAGTNASLSGIGGGGLASAGPVTIVA